MHASCDFFLWTMHEPERWVKIKGHAVICVCWVVLCNKIAHLAVVRYQWMVWSLNWFVLIPQHFPLATYAHELGSVWLDDKTTIVNLFYHLLTYHSSCSCIHNSSYMWHMRLKLHTQLDESYIYYISKYCIVICYNILLFCFVFGWFFWDILYL